MKLKYEKPLIAVENYVLSQAIAACITKIGFNDHECVFKDADTPHDYQRYAYLGYFLGGCKTSFFGMPEDDKICYHTNANTMFTS